MDFFFSSGTADRCEALQQLSYLNLSISLLILVGILISYLPQHYRIISRGTPEGISAGFILLGETSSTCALANILLLPGSRADVTCCKTVSPFECAAGLLGIAQVGTQWFCFTVMFLLFLIFTPRNPILPNTNTEEGPFKSRYTEWLNPRLNRWWSTVWGNPWQRATTVAVICILHGLVVFIASAALWFSRPHHLSNWANVLGLSAAGLAVVQYLPQLMETWQLGHVGSFSIPMMLIQTPGSFVWAASLFARFGIEGWSIWGIFLITGCLQGALLAMCITFEVRDRQQKLSTEGDPSNGSNARCIVGYIGGHSSTETDDEGGAVVENSPSERTPLISKRPRTPGQEH